MHPAISYELATARIADLRRQARRDALARAATQVPPGAPQQDNNRILVSLHLRPGSRRRAYQARGQATASSAAATS
jgi:hypothetical protein